MATRDTSTSVQRNGQQPAVRADGLPAGRLFERGVSGNPKGRPRSLKAYVLDKVGNDGAAIVDEIYKIATDRRLRGHNGARVRLAAWTELLDRGWGKSTSVISMDNEGATSRFPVVASSTAAPIAASVAALRRRQRSPCIGDTRQPPPCRISLLRLALWTCRR